MERTIETICLSVFMRKPAKIERISGKGHSNAVFVFSINGDRYVIRIYEDRSLKKFAKEKWCMEKAASVGIPTSICLSIGEHENYIYCILEYIEGTHGGDAPDNDIVKVWRKLGEYAKKINSIPVNSYGEEMQNPDDDRFTYGWSECVSGVLNWLFNNSFFSDHPILNSKHLEQIKNRLSGLYSWNFQSKLCHGNLAPKNTIIHPDGTIYLIDWGNAAGHRAPHLDLSEVLSWNYGDDKVDIFVDGYGLHRDRFESMKYDLDTLVVLKLISTVKWASEMHDDGLEADFVKYCIRKLENMDM